MRLLRREVFRWWSRRRPSRADYARTASTTLTALAVGTKAGRAEVVVDFLVGLLDLGRAIAREE